MGGSEPVVLHDVDWGWMFASLAVAGVALVLVGAMALWLWERRRVSPGPPSRDLSEESPALVNLLTHGFRVTHDAAAATVIDLAARGYVDIEEVSSSLSMVEVDAAARREELLLHEQSVLDELDDLAVDGVVPAEACSLGPEELSWRWWRRFTDQVETEALDRGYAKELMAFATWWLSILAALLLVELLFVAFGTGFDPRVALGDGWSTLVTVSAIVPVVAAATVLQGLAVTDDGRAAAQRWLGVRSALADADFGDRGPAAVHAWDEYLAYATAMGLAPAAARALPFGDEDARHAWSAVGGHWRLVQVSYPLWRPGWGRRPSHVLVGGVLVTLLAAPSALALAAVEGAPAAPALAVVAGAIAVVAAALAVAAAYDLRARRVITGEVLRRRSYFPEVDRGLPIIVHRPRFFIAIDDGTARRMRALSVDQATFDDLAVGDQVELTVTPLLGRVLRASSAAPASRP